MAPFRTAASVGTFLLLKGADALFALALILTHLARPQAPVAKTPAPKPSPRTPEPEVHFEGRVYPPGVPVPGQKVPPPVVSPEAEAMIAAPARRPEPPAPDAPLPGTLEARRAARAI